MPEHARPIAFCDHPFFGRWAAIIKNTFGAGTPLYEGTCLSDAPQKEGVEGYLAEGLPGSEASPSVRVQHGLNRMGERTHFYFNYSANEVKRTTPIDRERARLEGKAATKEAVLTLALWDLVIVEEKAELIDF